MAKVGRKPGRPKTNASDVPTAEKILSVASRLFMELGYDSVSTDHVAAEAGVTKAMVYYYFTSKPDLFTASIVRMMDNIYMRTKQLLDEHRPLHQRLIRIATARLSIPAPRHDFTTVLRNANHVLADPQVEKIQEAEQRLMELLADAFAKAVESGELRRDVHPVTASYLYVHSLTAVEHQIRSTPHHQGQAQPQQLAEHIIDFLFYGLASDLHISRH